MLEILKKAPVAGIYRNQDPANWDTFFKFYLQFLSSETGPRGQCAKRIRKQLQQNKQEVDKVLSPYGLSHKMHIRSIYVKFKYFVPCREYHLYQTTTQTLEKAEESLTRIKQPQHPMYVSIRDGMLKKHGPQYPYEQQIAKLQQNYENKIFKLKNDKLDLEDKLSQMLEYQNWMRMQKVMKKWFDQWVEADSGMGKDSCNRGQIFETKVLSSAIPYIISKQRYSAFAHIAENQLFTQESIYQLICEATQPTSKKAKLNRLHILLNMKWEPRALGEIDIAIVEYNSLKQRYEALVLIECKARLFDIREASYQVFPQFLKQDKKVELSGKYGPVYLSDQVKSYIVTTLPEYEFMLPIESSLKAALDRVTKDLPIEEVREEEKKKTLFEECSKRFKGQLSPLDWFLANDSDRIIVLGSQTEKIDNLAGS